MKTNKIIIETKTYAIEIPLKKEVNVKKEDWIAQMQKVVNECNELITDKVVNVYDANRYHICKYCGQISKGANKDLLCEDCREIFGHSLYNEL